MIRLTGYIFIVIGALFALATYTGTPLGIDVLWPAFLLIPGIGFHLFFFMKPSNLRAGVLVPGGILLVYAPLFFFSQLFFDGDMSYTWPLLLFGPVAGLMELYVFGGRKKGLLIPVAILTAVACIFLAANILSTQIGGILGVVFLAIGGYLLSLKKKKEDYTF